MTQSEIPAWDNGVARLFHADARSIPLPDESVHCVVTSPPYWGLRDYGLAPAVWGGESDCPHYWGDDLGSPGRRTGDGKGGSKHQIANRRDGMPPSAFCGECGAWRGALGLEPTVNLYVDHVVEIFREVWRVLRKDGTCWVNLGVSYCASPKGSLNGQDRSGLTSTRTQEHSPAGVDKRVDGLKSKDLVGMPWRVAFALQDDGWWLRSPVIWDKPNPMPESVSDRPTTSHEYIFMLTKSGSRLYWTHPERPGVRSRPAPDYRYICDETGAVVATAPRGWRRKNSGWRRVNLWKGHDYFFDGYAIREPLQETSIARISQSSFWQQEGGAKDYGNGVNANRSARRSLENLARSTPAGWNVNHDEPNLLGRYPPKQEKQRGNRRPHQGFIDRWDDMTMAEQRANGANARTVWRMATRPFKGRHFATFPEDLPRKCILAGTSDYGVCAECGAPWERVVERSFHPQADVSAEKGIKGAGFQKPMDASNRWDGFPRGRTATQTPGWQSTCACDAGTIPATVLDLFVGSGTTAIAAQKLGRRAVGVDASAEYLALAVDRVGAVSLPLPLGGAG